METITIKKIIRNTGGKLFFLFSLFLLLWSLPQTASAHCDSYDGPVIKDALKALEKNKVEFVLKWITEEHEDEIKRLFSKTHELKNADQEIYQIVEKHFLETLVRLHREGEGAPYTGLKAAGSTSPIIVLADQALQDEDIEGLSAKLNAHIDKVVREKYQKVAKLSKTKEESVEKGRAYVAAYVDYTHTLEGIHALLEHTGEEHLKHQSH